MSPIFKTRFVVDGEVFHSNRFDFGSAPKFQDQLLRASGASLPLNAPYNGPEIKPNHLIQIDGRKDFTNSGLGVSLAVLATAANDNQPDVPPPPAPKLLLGDCLEVMKTLPDHSVDLALTDLPYGSTACAWDSVIPFEELWEQYRRVLTPLGTVISTASQPFTSALVMSNPKWFKYAIVWEKTKRTGFQHEKQNPFNKHEDILVFSPGTVNGKHISNRQMTYNPQGLVELAKPKLNKNGGMGRTLWKEGRVYPKSSVGSTPQTHTNYPVSILQFSSHATRRGEESHPTQKPVSLYEYLVRTYSNDGDTVLDNCMGSGTTGVACVNVGSRNFIGIERDPKFFALAQKRIGRAHAEIHASAEIEIQARTPKALVPLPTTLPVVPPESPEGIIQFSLLEARLERARLSSEARKAGWSAATLRAKQAWVTMRTVGWTAPSLQKKGA